MPPVGAMRPVGLWGLGRASTAACQAPQAHAPMRCCCRHAASNQQGTVWRRQQWCQSSACPAGGRCVVMAASDVDNAPESYHQHQEQLTQGMDIEHTTHDSTAYISEQWDCIEDDLALDANVIELDDGDEYSSSAEVDAIELQAALLAAGSARLPAQAAEDEGSTSSGRWEGDEEDDPEFWDEDKERVFLVGLSLKGPGGPNRNSGRNGDAATYSSSESLEELGRLADTAGLKVVGSTYQALETPNPATYIGQGKVAEVARAVRALKVDTVVFDDELSPGQLRNLERAFTGGEGGIIVRVCDRTALILDIFSQRAATREGQLQVELAQTEFQLPRLTRLWTHLDRVGGGGQVKGAGEKQVEIDKRLLRDKAAALRKELETVRTHRRAYRERRSQTPISVIALVGYTNAGKSTLLNTLTQAGVLAEDKLFATLDPTTRRVRLPGNTEVLFSDTVGFIQKLPTQLVAAFRATLEEIQDASVILHLVDVSARNAAAQCDAVLKVLADLGTEDVPIITAWNKIDACADPALVRSLAAQRPNTVCISGSSGEGLDELMELIAATLEKSMVEVQVVLPYAAGDLLDDMHKCGTILSCDYTEAGSAVTAMVPKSLAGRLTQYRTDSKGGSGAGRGGGQQGAVANGSRAAGAPELVPVAAAERGQSPKPAWK